MLRDFIQVKPQTMSLQMKISYMKFSQTLQSMNEHCISKDKEETWCSEWVSHSIRRLSCNVLWSEPGPLGFAKKISDNILSSFIMTLYQNLLDMGHKWTWQICIKRWMAEYNVKIKNSVELIILTDVYKSEMFCNYGTKLTSQTK